MDIEDIKKFKETCDKQPIPSPKIVDGSGREVSKSDQQALILSDVINCPNCGRTNIENPMYNDYFCTDCLTAFD